MPVWKIKKTAARKASEEVRALADYVFTKMRSRNERQHEIKKQDKPHHLGWVWTSWATWLVLLNEPLRPVQSVRVRRICHFT